MSNRTVPKQKVIKQFSQLRIEKRIELSAIGIYQILWRGEAEKAFEPNKGTQIHRVWKMKKLDIRQQHGWKKFRHDCANMSGKSGGVVSPYGEYKDDSCEREKMPTAYTNEHYERVRDIMMRYLGRRERTLLYDLVQDDLRSGSDLQLEFLGLLRSGYSEEEKARAAGVVHVQNLLDRLADYYGF